MVIGSAWLLVGVSIRRGRSRLDSENCLKNDRIGLTSIGDDCSLNVCFVRVWKKLEHQEEEKEEEAILHLYCSRPQ